MESNRALQFNGMFSFVFHDSKTNSWLAARDHFGIKPLYYAQCGSDLVFASEIKAILEQSYQNFEIIIVDTSENNSNKQILSNYNSKIPINYIHVY